MLVTIALMAAGVVVRYLTLHPRPGSAAPAVPEITAVSGIEPVGESLGELVVHDGL